MQNPRSRSDGRSQDRCTAARHLAEETFVEHPGYERPPVEVENLQHHQHGVEEVVAEEGLEALHRIHPGAVDEPGVA